MKRKIIDTFHEETSFDPNGKYLIIHSSDINPCQYISAVLKGKGLRDGDVIKSFGNMIQRKVRSIKNEKIYPTLPYSTGEMFDLLEKGHLQELYNVNFYSIKGTFKLNHAGYAEIESKHLATKVWSICNDWEALLFPRKYSRQLVTGFTIHRLTALKDVIQTLHKMNCTDITQQNKIWADVAVS